MNGETGWPPARRLEARGSKMLPRGFYLLCQRSFFSRRAAARTASTIVCVVVNKDNVGIHLYAGLAHGRPMIIHDANPKIGAASRPPWQILGKRTNRVKGEAAEAVTHKGGRKQQRSG